MDLGNVTPIVRPNPQYSHMHPECLAALSYCNESVQKAATNIQEEKLNFYGLAALLIRLAMHREYEVPLPDGLGPVLKDKGRREVYPLKNRKDRRSRKNKARSITQGINKSSSKNPTRIKDRVK